jgi:hypothetical protein
MIQICRQMLGGHGYSLYSRYAVLYNDNDSNLSGEGDNYVLMQQIAKFILDNSRKATKENMSKFRTLSFLKFMHTSRPEEVNETTINDLGIIEKIFEWRVFSKMQRLIARLDELKLSGKNDYDSWQAAQANYILPLGLSYGKCIINIGELYYIQSLNRSIAKC